MDDNLWEWWRITYRGKLVDVPYKSVFNELFLIQADNIVKDCLYCMGSLFVATDIYEVIFDHLKYPQALFHRAIKDQFLEEVVSILIFHDPCHILAYLI